MISLLVVVRLKFALFVSSNFVELPFVHVVQFCKIGSWMQLDVLERSSCDEDALQLHLCPVNAYRYFRVVCLLRLQLALPNTNAPTTFLIHIGGFLGHNSWTISIPCPKERVSFVVVIPFVDHIR